MPFLKNDITWLFNKNLLHFGILLKRFMLSKNYFYFSNLSILAKNLKSLFQDRFFALQSKSLEHI